MTDDETGIPARVKRAFRDHDSFETAENGVGFVSMTTAFDGRVEATALDDGRIEFTVTVRVPMLSSVTTDEMASVVEDGWLETFELRVADVGEITKTERDLSPKTRLDGGEIVVEEEFADLNERRGVADAAALIDFVEGTYVQGVIPGYEYTDPVASILSEARQTAKSDGL